MSLASELKFFGVQPLGAQSVPNSSLAFMPALTVKANITGAPASPQDVTTLPVTIGGTGTSTAFTPGSVHFSGASGIYLQDNANFFWDSTNHRLGIGITAPAAPIDIQAAQSAALLRVRTTGANSSQILIDNAGGGNQSYISLFDAGVAKWSFGKQTDNSFFALDAVNAKNWITVTTAGAVTLGETGIGVTAVAGLTITPAQVLSVTPVGNAVTTLTSFVSQVSDVGGGTGYEYGAIATMTTTHNTGSTAPNKVALYGAATNNNATGGNIWSFNTVNTLGASSPATVTSTGYEIDINNVSGTARTYANLGAASYGLQVTGVSTSANTAAILLSGNAAAPQWTSGIVFNNFRSAQSSNYGIDFGLDANNTIANAWINFPVGTSRSFRGGNLTQSTAVGPPAVGALSGLGATGSAAMLNAAPNAGIVTLTVAGAGPASAGLFTLTWPNAFPNQPNCVAMVLSGSNAWNAAAVVQATAISTTQVTFQWANGAVNLVAGTYQVMYVVMGT